MLFIINTYIVYYTIIDNFYQYDDEVIGVRGL